LAGRGVEGHLVDPGETGFDDDGDPLPNCAPNHTFDQDLGIALVTSDLSCE
jgi:hypothetical protein